MATPQITNHWIHFHLAYPRHCLSSWLLSLKRNLSNALISYFRDSGIYFYIDSTGWLAGWPSIRPFPPNDRFSFNFLANIRGSPRLYLFIYLFGLRGCISTRLEHIFHTFYCALLSMAMSVKIPLLFIYLAIWSERVLYIGSQKHTQTMFIPNPWCSLIYINYQKFASHLLINSECHLCNNKSLPCR